MITRFQIREEVELLERAIDGLEETFLSSSDPSIAVLAFVEKLSSQLGAIKHAYAHTAKDRNALPDQVMPYIRAIRDACAALEASLSGPPEDTNRSLEDDRWDG